MKYIYEVQIEISSPQVLIKVVVSNVALLLREKECWSGRVLRPREFHFEFEMSSLGLHKISSSWLEDVYVFSYNFMSRSIYLAFLIRGEFKSTYEYGSSAVAMRSLYL